jgi:hypothetical protein
MTSQAHRWVWISIVALTACKGGDAGGKAEETDVAKAPVAPTEPVKPADPAPTAAPATKTVYFDVHELGVGKATAKVAAEEHAKATAATDKTVAFANYWVDEKNGRIIRPGHEGSQVDPCAQCCDWSSRSPRRS